MAYNKIKGRKKVFYALLVSKNTGDFLWTFVRGWDKKQADKAARYYSQCLNYQRSYHNRYSLLKLHFA